MRHCVRFGSYGEKTYFTGPLSDTYDGLSFNANLVAWSAAGVAGFICGSNLVRKPFFIDPLTHAFQHDPSALTSNGDEVKPSVQKLIEAYGEPVAALAGTQALLPDDLSDSGLLRAFTERVVRFQATTVDEEARQTDAWEILQFTHGEELDLRPTVVTPPYFFLRPSTLEEWLPVNLEALRFAADFAGDASVAAQLVLTPDLLRDDNRRNQLIGSYIDAGAQRVHLWVDDFSEQEAGREELAGLLEFGRGFSERGCEVVNLYGGFFSTLLTGGKGELAGVCHGPQYGESRSVTPVGGGLPTARFYVRALHHRLRFGDAFRLLKSQGWLDSRQAYLEEVCSCPQCEDLIAEHGVEEGFLRYGDAKDVTFERGGRTVSMRYPLREAQEAATKHYMWAKQWEHRVVREGERERVLARLQRAHDQFRRVLGDAVGYIRNWAEVLGRA